MADADLFELAKALRLGVVWQSNASIEVIAKVLQDVRDGERERCAKVAADYGDWTDLTCDQKQFAAVLVAADEIATAIRQNGAPKADNSNLGTIAHHGEIR